MLDASTIPSLDLVTLGRLYQAKRLQPRDVVERILARRAAHPDPAVWIYPLPAVAVLEQAEAVQQRLDAGDKLPLYGVPFAVKDNIDVAGHATTAACPAYSYAATATAPVVARLLEAGAILVGKTNMDQFATGLAGDRSPFGACRNALDPAYISGGSSSGSAVAVAAGLVSFALGTDTAGSGRIPAGCNNIVGLKPTPGLLSTQGTVPACPSLDCLSILALTAGDALHVCRVATNGPLTDHSLQEKPGHRGGDGGRPQSFAVPRDEDLEFFGDRDQAEAFQDALARLERLGMRKVPVDFRPFREVGSMLYEGPWLADRLAHLDGFLEAHPDAVHPVTRAILEGGRRYSAVELFKCRHRLAALRPVCDAVFDRTPLLVVPTLPALPTLARVQEDSVGWSRRLGYYTNFVNLLQLAALAVPAGFTGQGLPAGITLIGPGGSESRLCEFGQSWQRRLDLQLGATAALMPVPDAFPSAVAPPPSSTERIRVAVAGAHLRGQPLHKDLNRWGARFAGACRTAPRYRFVALMDLDPPRPGLLRDDQGTGPIAVELYDLPPDGFGKLVASVAPPLAIGTIELENGAFVKGFLCESWAAARARDITSFGGWLPFRASLPQPSARSVRGNDCFPPVNHCFEEEQQ